MADLDDITKILIEGFLEEPMDNYCYPFRFKYTEDHFRWLREEYAYYLDNPQKYLVHVAQPSEQSEGAKSVALAVWETAVLAKAPPWFLTRFR